MAGNASPFLEAIEARRSYYPLSKDLPISDARVQEIATAAIKHVPSSFNSQSTRLVVLLNAEHEQFWDFVKEVLAPHLPDEEAAKATNQRIAGFRAGHGTILFFEDPAPIKKLQTAFAKYAEHFPQWSEHTSAMHQYAIWTALEAEGCGANLQHYNPIIDIKAKQHWNINLEWSLKAQLVFGGLGEGAKEGLKPKEFQPVEERVFVHGAK